MNPSFKVHASYFYALAASLPMEVSADIRYRMACLADEEQVVGDLHKAIDAGIIDPAPGLSPEQAARRLRALGATSGAPVVDPGVGSALVQAWLSYASVPPKDDPEQDIAPFWNGVLGNPAQASGSPPTANHPMAAARGRRVATSPSRIARAAMPAAGASSSSDVIRSSITHSRAAPTERSGAAGSDP